MASPTATEPIDTEPIPPVRYHRQRVSPQGAVSLWFLVLLLLGACRGPTVPTPLERVLARGELTVIVPGPSDDFFWSTVSTREGVSGGLEYELVELLARHLGVGLKIFSVSGQGRAVSALLAGQGDMIAGAEVSIRQEDSSLIITQPFGGSPEILPGGHGHGHDPQMVAHDEDSNVRSWVVPRHGQGLKNRLDAFLSQVRSDGRLAQLIQHYIPPGETDPELGLAALHQRSAQRLPPILGTIRQAAAQFGFDWELIAALIYQESQWNPAAVSPAGARGLMQLLPLTARSLGVSDIHNPQENIQAGVQYLKAYYEFYNRAPGEDRLKIAMAAYNIGIGHILDARNLARRRRLDPNRWASLEETLPLLSQPQYYRRSRYGYCRGSEPVNYVRRIMIYYAIIKAWDFSVEEGSQSPVRSMEGTTGETVPIFSVGG